MAGSRDRIQVIGLREFRANLRQVHRNLPRAVRRVANKAADIVVAEARPRVPLGPPEKGHALMSIRSASTQSSGRVKGGGARFPYYPWLDFGGHVGRNASVSRPVRRGGRYIYPAFVDKRDEITEEMDRGIHQLAEAAGIRVRTGRR